MKQKAVLLVLCICLYRVCGYAELSGSEKVQHNASDINEVLGRLEEKISGMQTLQTGFIQEKNLAIFNQKVVLKGTVYMQKPALFAWHTEEPVRYSLIIKGNVVYQWDEDTNQVQRISLSKKPAFKTVIGQMRKWFSGVYTSLLGEYDVVILSDNPVSLKFIPRKTAVASDVISSVTVVFREDERYIYQIYIEEKSGDSTLLTFVDTLLNIPLDAAVWMAKPRVQ